MLSWLAPAPLLQQQLTPVTLRASFQQLGSFSGEPASTLSRLQTCPLGRRSLPTTPKVPQHALATETHSDPPNADVKLQQHPQLNIRISLEQKISQAVCLRMVQTLRNLETGVKWQVQAAHIVTHAHALQQTSSDRWT